MANRDDLKPILHRTKDYAMIAPAQTETALPFAVKWRDISNTGATVSKMRSATARSMARNCVRASGVNG